MYYFNEISQTDRNIEYKKMFLSAYKPVLCRCTVAGLH